MSGILGSSSAGNGKNLLNLFKTLQITSVRNKNHLRNPRPKNPVWFVKPVSAKHDELLTSDAKQFIQSQVHQKYGSPVIKHGIPTYENPVQSLVNSSDINTNVEWNKNLRRTGVIARKIGIYPLWTKNGKKISTTLLQIVDNHVIKYIPPDQFAPTQKPRISRPERYGCLLVGALSTDPTHFTKEYCGMFADSGVMPKAVLHRFIISPEGALPPGTPLTVSHFKVGDSIDVRGKTMDRGFQGVMKRWGFKGQPASHGQTKTHRRPGNIGGGGEKGRVWPGTKMPGHMGNRWRILKGLTVWRINPKYNVMWVSGQNVPGDTNSLVYVFDTMLPLRRRTEAPPFPTAVEEYTEDEIWHPDLHDFREGSISFNQ